MGWDHGVPVQKKGCENQPWAVSFPLRAGGTWAASPYLFPWFKHWSICVRSPCLLVLHQLKAAAVISVPWAALDKLGPVPHTQALCLAQSCGSRHCWDSDCAPRELRKGSDEPGCPVVISAHSVVSMCIPLKQSLFCALKHCNPCRKPFSFPWKPSPFLFPCCFLQHWFTSFSYTSPLFDTV